MSKPVCVILGVGPGNGMSIARKFAAEGYAVALCARRGAEMEKAASEIPGSKGYAFDVTDTDGAAALFAAIETDLGPVETLVYNAGSGAWGTVDDLAPEDLLQNCNVNAVGLMAATKAALPALRVNKGKILVIGASAALRGRPASIAFAAGKAAQRSVAQSLARQLGPEGIHVAYLVLDGMIDLETTKARMPDKPDTFFLSADGIADATWALASQDPQAWTFELDLRPFAENW